MRRATIVAAAVAGLAVAGGTMRAGALPTSVAAAPGAAVTGWATPVPIALEGTALTVLNADVMPHSVVARDAFGPDGMPWCTGLAPGRCPLFASAVARLGEAADVGGLANAEPGIPYWFVCGIHGASMTGVLVLVDPEVER